MNTTIIQGDCIDVMKKIEPNFIDLGTFGKIA